MTHFNRCGRYPSTRMRRNRATDWSRRLVREYHVRVDDLIWPVFVQEGKGLKTPVASLPGVTRYSIDTLVDAVGEAQELGIPAIAIFPMVPMEKKTELAEEAFNEENLVCRTINAIKKAHSDIGVIADVALDPYTAHGQDGLIRDGVILNDETNEVLCKQAIAQAKAGCDVIAPSDMMDGRIGAVRQALDDGGFQQVQILSYAAKYASKFYGPFRDAISSAGNLKGGSKATYQMDPPNSDEALREVALDVDEGADMVMVKPGMPYLDIIFRIKETFGLPTYAYQVSGEYAMLKAAIQNGWLENDPILLESLVAFKRAGADGVLTYAAVEVAKLLKKG